ncbi:MAG: hypothetical protein A2V87_01890 [Deltaproteobacteria bacterium RBG_16_58_17]|nr:MAG: hypothetical protein A2V87_01890 [Deltaproteobacteria bacterium RBG_16_58_17]OHE17225.1 MAG: hypothetical protein A2X96_12405 [Syntrophobacterales bacterium GWC2_56_13]OHE19659.1 MAG: hypothetical protein A2X95_08720 [Syntrophobacterales bacterium GWF2_56_9]
MINNKDINIRLIIHVAKCLGDLRKKVVFVGGCATGLFITDPAIKNAESVELEKGLTIQLVSPPYFLATKVEAFKGRGGGDYMDSHDMEDIITVLDGRPEIISEIRSSSEELKPFLADTFHGFLAQEGFRDALPGHLPSDRASQARLPRLIKRLEEISEIQK